MKHVNSFAIGILALFLSGQIFASDAGHTSEAMEHAGQALAHGEDGHADVFGKTCGKSFTSCTGC